MMILARHLMPDDDGDDVPVVLITDLPVKISVVECYYNMSFPFILPLCKFIRPIILQWSALPRF